MDTVIRDYFSEESGVFDSYTKKSLTIEKEQRNWKKLYSEVLGSDVKKVLNVGCGPGTEAILLAGMGYEVTALDFSPEMIELTKQNAETCGVSVATVVGDAENLPFQEGEFDAIVSNYALWAIPHPQTAINEWFRVLRDGGRVAYVDGIWSSKGYSFFRRMWVKKAAKMRRKDSNHHQSTPNPERSSRMTGLWSNDADRPVEDLKMVEAAGFGQIRKIDKVDRKIFSGRRYIEYGYHKVHFMIIADKPRVQTSIWGLPKSL